jgi:hypothetical protein
MDIFFTVLPFVLLIVFWGVIARRGGAIQKPIEDKLEEIRLELEGIRRALEGDPYRKS